jgi:hypothetical protein
MSNDILAHCVRQILAAGYISLAVLLPVVFADGTEITCLPA